MNNTFNTMPAYVDVTHTKPKLQSLSGLVTTSVRRWYPHLLRDHEAIASVTHTLFTFPEFREDMGKADKYRLANRAAYEVSKESGWRKTSKKWFRPETALSVKCARGTMPLVEVVQAKEKTADAKLAARLRDTETCHEALAILNSEGITGSHVSQHVQQMFQDRAKADKQINEPKAVSSPIIRSPRQQFIADNWQRPTKQIAGELGISVPAVHMAAKAMGLRPKTRFWHSR